jgi:fermentation-respiration switch protein FrsA (DUF1100 family)
MVTVLAIVLVLYLVLCLVAYFFQRRLIFLPQRALDATPDQVGLSYRDVFFHAEDGVRLHGWYIPAEDPCGTLLFCHGNAGNISHRLGSVGLFHDLRLNVFLFDYRGYGRSRGRPGEEGIRQDAWAAWQHLIGQEGMVPESIVILGRSLGGAVAIELASRVTPRAVIIESSFTSLVDLAIRHYPWLPLRLLLRIQFDAKDRVRQVTGPKLFVHSPQDEVVPYALGLRLYRQARHPKQFLRIRGSHNDGFLTSGALYREGVRAFLDAAWTGAAPPHD